MLAVTRKQASKTKAPCCYFWVIEVKKKHLRSILKLAPLGTRDPRLSGISAPVPFGREICQDSSALISSCRGIWRLFIIVMHSVMYSHDSQRKGYCIGPAFGKSKAISELAHHHRDSKYL